MISICRTLFCGWAVFGENPIKKSTPLLGSGGVKKEKDLSLAINDDNKDLFSKFEQQFSLVPTNKKIDSSCGFKFDNSTEIGYYSNDFKTIKVSMYNKDKHHLEYKDFKVIYKTIRTVVYQWGGVLFPSIESKDHNVNQIECYIDKLTKQDRDKITLFKATNLLRLPSNIGKLEKLKEINLRNSKVTDLSSLPEFKDLTTIKLTGRDYENFDTMGLKDRIRLHNCVDPPVAKVAQWIQDRRKGLYNKQLKVLLTEECELSSLLGRMCLSIQASMFLFDFDGNPRECASLETWNTRSESQNFYHAPTNCQKEDDKKNGCLFFDNYPKYYQRNRQVGHDHGVIQDSEGIPGSQELVMKFLKCYGLDLIQRFTEKIESIRLPDIQKIYQIPSWLRDDENESRVRIQKEESPIWDYKKETSNKMMEILKKFKNLKNLKIPSSLPTNISESVVDYQNKIAGYFLKELPGLERFQIGKIEIDLTEFKKNLPRLEKPGDDDKCRDGKCLERASETS